MITKDTATRSEAEDVTSTLLEGADAFILTHETAIGKYPIDAVV